MDKSNDIVTGQNIAVVGSGICGMCTGLSLAAKGHKVTIFERDTAPPEGDADQAFFEWQRKGAAQFRHPHAFLGLMCSLLEEHYPDLVEEFWLAGARKVPFSEMVPPELANQYKPEPIDEKMWLIMCRRATMETVLRRYVERKKNIAIKNSVMVKGLRLAEPTASGIPVVSGLELTGLGEDDRGQNFSFECDVVVDASGRTSKFVPWLIELGREIEIESHSAEIVYYTRHYKRLPGVEEPSRHEGERSAGDLGYLKFGVFPGEAGHFAVILCLPVAEEAMRENIKTGEGFDQICQSIPGLARWIGTDRALATTNSFGFADIHAVWRHFVADGKPAALNFFAVGDAALRTNPLYGRGCSIGAKHAHILADVLSEQTDPLARALLLDERTESELRPIYEASLKEDVRGIKRAEMQLTGEAVEPSDGLKKWFGLALGDAISAASRERMHVFRGVMKTFNLIEKPGDFLKEFKIQMTILRYMLRGRSKNAIQRLQPGPTRDEMLVLLSEQESGVPE